MTTEQIEQWKRERDIARAIKDPTERAIALEKVYDHRDDLQMECIQHQADRIKTSLQNDKVLNDKIDKLDGRVAKVEGEMKPLKETDREYRAWKLRAEGAKLLWRLLRYGAAIGGSSLITYLLSHS